MKNEMTDNIGKIKIAVIGGGASGLMCACVSAQNGADVTLFEKNKSDRILKSETFFDNAYLGKKLLITGKGRCNVTNNSDVAEFMKNVPTNPKFLYAAYNAFPSEKTMKFFEDNGIRLKTERGNRVFPQSDKSIDILSAFKKKLKENGVKVVNRKVVSIDNKDGSFEILTEEKEKYKFDKCVICTGGLSYPKTGSDGDGYKFAKKFGHTVREPEPSLVPLECKEKELCESMSGLTLKNVKLSVSDALNPNSKTVFSETGEMLFTHFGISGPLVLSASAHIKNPEKNKYRADIDLKPALEIEKTDEKLVKLFSEKSNANVSNALCSMLPKSMTEPFCKYCGVSPSIKANSVDRETRKRMAKAFKKFSLEISAFRPIEEAVITSGGINVKEINPSTMESKIVKNLYFAGEVIDVDAYTGGFNLQIAFCTAYLAAKSACGK
jgi:predicted Rossmann fold flavoprotein